MIKRLSKSIREYLLPTILTPMCMIGEVAMEILIPYKLADMIDLGVEVGDLAVVKQIGLTLVCYALISLTFGALGAILGSKASAGFAKNLRHDMYENIQKFAFSNIDKFSTAGLVTRMTTDVTQVQMSYMMLTRMAFRAPFMLVFALIATARINSKLPLVFLIAVPILLVALIIVIKVAMPLFEKMFKIYDRLNTVVQENLRGIRVVKAYNREDHEKEKFSEVSITLFGTSVKVDTIMAFVMPIMQVAMYSCILLLAWVGAKFVVQDIISKGQLMSVFSYIMNILTSLMFLAVVIVMMTTSAASAKRIVEVLDEKPDIENCDNPLKEIADGSIKFENVSFAYANQKACLSDINIDIKSGQTIGIIGGTGSGKTSLVQLIPRLYDTTSGVVSVGGVDVKNIDLDTLRSSVAMVLQKNVLFSGSVADNLKWGKADASSEEMNKALEIAQAKGFVEKLGGLDYMIEQGGTNVSGGQRQRLCIARALMMNPKILILDDSTSAVDTATERAIREGLKDYMPDLTKIIIAQRISSVEGADQIIVLDDGKISGIGTHDELLKTNEIYKDVYESQTKGGGDFDEPRAE